MKSTDGSARFKTTLKSLKNKKVQLRRQKKKIKDKSQISPEAHYFLSLKRYLHFATSS